MRITNRMMVDTAIQHIAENQDKISKLQNQVSTGKQYQVASEDPLNASLSLGLSSNLRTLGSYVETAGNTKDWMNATEFSMDQLETIATRASTLLLQGANDTLSDKDRASSLGIEMRDLLSQAIDVGNTKHNDQYIFAGYKVKTKPFVLENDTTQPTYNDFLGNTGVYPKMITYNGDSGTMQRSLAPDQNVPLNINGDQAIKDFLKNLAFASEALVKNPKDSASLQTALGGLQSSLDTLSRYRTSNGTRLRQVETAGEYLDQVTIETKSLLSKKQDVNIAEAIALLSNQKNTYQAALEVSSRAISALSLFDYMQ